MTSVLSSQDSSTQIRFEQHVNRANVAQCPLLLSNISHRPLYYVLKCSNDAYVTAKPSSSGRLSARSSVELSLIWRRPPLAASWREAVQPRIVLLTHFVDSSEKPSRHVTATRLRAFIHENCSGGSPSAALHAEQLLLDTAPSPTGGGLHVRVDGRSATFSSSSLSLGETRRRGSSDLTDPFAQQYNQISDNAMRVFVALLVVLCVLLWRNASYGLGGVLKSPPAVELSSDD